MPRKFVRSSSYGIAIAINSVESLNNKVSACSGVNCVYILTARLSSYTFITRVERVPSEMGG